MRRSTAIALTLLLPTLTLGLKRDDVPGYTFVQVTDNDVRDVNPRFPSNSLDGVVVWQGQHSLPGTTSGSRDYEIMQWDGSQMVQITDDDVMQERPVVNTRGEMAWMTGQDQGSCNGEVVVRAADGSIEQLTNDPECSDPSSTDLGDRYPEINEDGYVVWGRRFEPAISGWYAAVYRMGEPTFTVYGNQRTYRPHLNNFGLIAIATLTRSVYDVTGQTVFGLPHPNTLGYAEYRRWALNDLGYVVLEADPLPDYDNDFVGERDIVVWDPHTQTAHVVYSSAGTGLWVGRPHINNSGMVTFHGQGCLAGCTSTPWDFEVFLYRVQTGTVEQVTDDNGYDDRPKVSDAGRIVWLGRDGYPGSTSGVNDEEVFVAVADTDRDGVFDPDDNCDHLPNASQTDLGGNGVGDDCDCGDQTLDGTIDARDVSALQLCTLGLQPCETLCDADEDASCGAADALAVSSAVAGTSGTYCSENPGPFF